MSSTALAECTSGDCINGQGTFVYSNGTYVGEFLNGFRSGQGTYTWNSGSKYVGGFLNNLRNGNAVYTWYYNGEYGGTYTGEYLNGERSGLGTYIWVIDSRICAPYVKAGDKYHTRNR